jgi:5-methylcytosine-specific restriction endonuclease McrA
MGVKVHKLTNKDFEALTAVCAVDGPVKIKVYGNTYRCDVAYRAHQQRMNRDRAGNTFKDHKTNTCVRCGFVGDLCQMDLDHINGDRSDHRAENLQTLCSNCHRLKSYRPALYAPVLADGGS